AVVSTTQPMAAAWPTAIGTSDLATALPFCSCIPSATANTHPIPGLSPWKAVRHVSLRVRVTIGVRRCVAPFQPYLVCAQPVKLEKEVLIELDPALSVCIDLHHPTLYTIRIELLIPRRVERVRKVDALAIAADLDHLRT